MQYRGVLFCVERRTAVYVVRGRNKKGLSDKNAFGQKKAVVFAHTALFRTALGITPEIGKHRQTRYNTLRLSASHLPPVFRTEHIIIRSSHKPLRNVGVFPVPERLLQIKSPHTPCGTWELPLLIICRFCTISCKDQRALRVCRT